MYEYQEWRDEVTHRKQVASVFTSTIRLGGKVLCVTIT